MIRTLLYVMIIFIDFKTKDELNATYEDARAGVISMAWCDMLPRSFESAIEICWIVLELSLWIDRQDQKVKRARKVALQSKVNYVDLVFDLLVILTLVCRIFMRTSSNQLMESPCSESACSAFVNPTCDDPCELYDLGRKLYQAYQVLIAFMTIRIIFTYLDFMNIYQPLGVLIITISGMMQDVSLFLQLFVVVNLAFMVSGSALQIAGLFEAPGDPNEDPDPNPFGAEGEFWSPLWLTFGYFEPSSYSAVSAPVAYVYLFISCIVMVNLLVAMFADTFQRVQGSSEVEYVFIECERMFEFRDVVRSTPPVLNVPFIVYDFFHSIYQRWGHMPLAIFTRRRQLGKSAPTRREASRSSVWQAWRRSSLSGGIPSYIGGQQPEASVQHMTDIQPPLSNSPSLETETGSPSYGRSASPSSSQQVVMGKAREAFMRLLKVKESHRDLQDSKLLLRQANQPQKKVVLHKGALLVSAYIKEQDRFAADGPQDIAASILRGFDQAKQRHHEEQVSTRRMVAGLEKQLSEMARRINFPIGGRVLHDEHGMGTA